MSAKKKTIDGVEYEVVDTTPVELDPPDPTLARWEELLDRDRMIYHDGDAEKIMPFPRPAWSDPDQDLITNSGLTSLYRAEPIPVTASRHDGRNDGKIFTPASVFVQPVLGGSGNKAVRLSFSKWSGSSGWDNAPYMALTIPEVANLIDVLSAAVDLIESDE